jgi:hypothetical protein
MQNQNAIMVLPKMPKNMFLWASESLKTKRNSATGPIISHQVDTGWMEASSDGCRVGDEESGSRDLATTICYVQSRCLVMLIRRWYLVGWKSLSRLTSKRGLRMDRIRCI